MSNSCFCSKLKNSSNGGVECLVYQSPISLTSDKKSATFFNSSSIFSKIFQGTVINDYKFDEDQKDWNILDKIKLENNDQEYRFIQFHFHQPGEHVLNDKSYASELHLVFETKSGHIFVLAFLIQLCKKNTSKTLRRIINNDRFSIPKVGNYWSYAGSLTTPPFTNIITWNVSDTILRIKKEDLDYLKVKSKGKRPLQERSGRDIVYACSDH